MIHLMDDFVCCPRCGSALEDRVEPLVHLACVGCGRGFPVRGGIADFVDESALDDMALGQHDIYHGEEERIPDYAELEAVRRHTDHVIRLARGHGMVLPTWLGLEVSRIIEDLRPREGERLLDVGCGVGTVLNSMNAIYGTTGVGIDFAGAALSACVSCNPFENLYCRGDALALPFADESFDIAVSFGVIEHVSDQERMVKEMVRVTGREGRVLVLTPRRDDRYTWHWWQRLTSRGRYRLGVEHLWGHDPDNFLEPPELASYMTRNGLEGVETRAVHPLYSTILDEMFPGLISVLLERPLVFRATAFALGLADEPLSGRGYGNEFVATGWKGGAPDETVAVDHRGNR
jgi:SAM-dependent methyltransferase/uncharacterized protein YbaR (Trm112 family)